MSYKLNTKCFTISMSHILMPGMQIQQKTLWKNGLRNVHLWYSTCVVQSWTVSCVYWSIVLHICSICVVMPVHIINSRVMCNTRNVRVLNKHVLYGWCGFIVMSINCCFSCRHHGLRVEVWLSVMFACVTDLSCHWRSMMSASASIPVKRLALLAGLVRASPACSWPCCGLLR